jgi:TolA-binding protein
VIGDVAPLLASALGQQAVSAALSGDLQQAAALRDRASNLASGFQPRLQRRLQVLRPQIQQLCPDIERLSELQQGLRASNGRLLNLVQVGQ